STVGWLLSMSCSLKQGPFNHVKLSSSQRIVLLNYNKDTKQIDFRHYSIRLQPVGVSRRIRKFVQNHQVPDLRNLQDVTGYGSESEAEEEAATVTLSSDVGRVNRASKASRNWSQDDSSTRKPGDKGKHDYEDNEMQDNEDEDDSKGSEDQDGNGSEVDEDEGHEELD
ncbi:hypothetical protein S245_042956, partial [Arachis hypogaea]